MHVSIKVYNFSCAERIDSFLLLTNKAGGVLSSKQERNALYNVVTNCKTALQRLYISEADQKMESNPDIIGYLISSPGTETLSPNLDLESDL